MEWPFFSNLMLESNKKTQKNDSTELQHVIISGDNTKIAILVDFDKNYIHKHGDVSTRSSIIVYDIHKGKIAEFIANNDTKPVFSCDGTILIAGGPKKYNANPVLGDSHGILVCDLLDSSNSNMATPIHHFKRKRFLNIHFVTNDFVWCDQRNTTENPNGQRHIGFRLWRNGKGRVVRSTFKQDEARFSFRDEHSWFGSTHAIQLIAHPSTKTVVEYFGPRICRPYPNTSMAVVRLNDNREVIASQRINFWGQLRYSGIEISIPGNSIMVLNKSSERDIARIAIYRLTNATRDFVSSPHYIRGSVLTFPPVKNWRIIPEIPKIWRFDGRWMVFSHPFGSDCHLSRESPCCALVTQHEEQILDIGEEDMVWSPNIWNIILNGKPGSAWPPNSKDNSIGVASIEKLYKSH